jgi:WD40 repeat protein
MTFSPDGRTVATPSGSSVKIRDAVTGQTLRTLNGHKGNVNAIAYSPDGRWLASCSDDATVRLWNVRDGSCAPPLTGHTAEVADLAFFPDGRTLASVSRMGVVRLWEISGGRPLESFSRRVVGDVSIAISPDGSRIALTGRKFSLPPVSGILVLEARTGRELSWYSGHGGEVRSGTFSPDGKLLASAGDDNMVRLWDVATGKEVKNYRTRGRWNTRAVFSPDGRTLAASGYDDTVEVWDVSQDQDVLTRRGIFPRGIYCALDADAGRLAAYAFSSFGLAVFDTRTGQRLVRFQGFDRPEPYGSSVSPLVAFSPDGGQVAAGLSDGRVRIWDAKTGALLQNFNGIPDEGVNAVAYSSDSKWLAAAGGNRVCVWEVPSGRAVATLTGDLTGVNGLAFSPDGRQLLTGDQQCKLLLWDVETGRVVRTHSKPGSFGRCRVLFSPDGRQFAAVTYGDFITVFDADSGKERFTLNGHSGDVFQIAMSPDGKRLASAADDGTVRVWNLSTGRELLRLDASLRVPNAAGPPGILAFSRDGRTLTAVGTDGTMFVWDATPPSSELDK